MGRTTGSWDESDVRIRPNKRGSRPRTKDRPAHEDAVIGRMRADFTSCSRVQIIFTGFCGRSPCPVGVVSIFFTTSMPETILPNTGCFD